MAAGSCRRVTPGRERFSRRPQHHLLARVTSGSPMVNIRSFINVSGARNPLPGAAGLVLRQTGTEGLSARRAPMSLPRWASLPAVGLAGGSWRALFAPGSALSARSQEAERTPPPGRIRPEAASSAAAMGYKQLPRASPAPLAGSVVTSPTKAERRGKRGWEAIELVEQWPDRHRRRLPTFKRQVLN